MAPNIVTDIRVVEFVSEQLSTSFIPPFTTIGLEKDGAIIAGVIFHCFEGPNVHLTIAGSGWTRGLLKAVGSYVFETLGCERFTLTTEKPEVAKLGERLGGVTEGIMRNQFGNGRNAFLVGVLKDEYRFK